MSQDNAPSSSTTPRAPDNHPPPLNPPSNPPSTGSGSVRYHPDRVSPRPSDSGGREPSSIDEEDMEFYEIDIMNFRANEPRNYPDNSICTTKYSILSFVPLNLFEQFRKISNFFFLTVMVLSLIPGASPINPGGAIAPLVLVVAVSAAKDAYEDFKRHRSDTRANEQPVEVYRGGEFTEILSEDVVVGDILRIKHGEEIKADCVLLNSSLPDGVAYIETANLDGETNAKIKRATDATVRYLGTMDQLIGACVVSYPTIKSSSQKFFNKLRKPPQFVADATQQFKENVGLGEKGSDRRHARQPNPDKQQSPPRPSVSNNSNVQQQPSPQLESPDSPPTNKNKSPNSVPNSATPHFHEVPSSPTFAQTPTFPQGGNAKKAGSFSTTRSQVVSPMLPGDPHQNHPFQDRRPSATSPTPPPSQQQGIGGVKILCSLPNADLSNWQGQLIFHPKAQEMATNSVNKRGGNNPMNPHEQEMSERAFVNPNNSSSDGQQRHTPTTSTNGSSSSFKHVTSGGTFQRGGNDEYEEESSHINEIDISEPVALGLDQYLFRGAILRNTESALAVVVYAGEETKMFLNLQQKPPKRSQFDREMTVLMGIMFIVAIILVLLFSALSVWWAASQKPTASRNGGVTSYGMWYLQYYLEDMGNAERFGFSIITYFILLSYLIPISLFITLELNKGLQILFITWDEELAHYDPDVAGENCWRTCRPKTSNLTSQLGRVKYIFTDKTGTLTENKMRYVGGFVNSFTYKTSDDPQGLSNYLLQLGYDVPRSFLAKKLEEAKNDATQKKIEGGFSTEDCERGNDDVVIKRELQGRSGQISRQGSALMPRQHGINFDRFDANVGGGDARSLSDHGGSSGGGGGHHWRTSSGSQHQRTSSGTPTNPRLHVPHSPNLPGDSIIMAESHLSSNASHNPHRRVVSFGGISVDELSGGEMVSIPKARSAGNLSGMNESYQRSIRNTATIQTLLEGKDEQNNRAVGMGSLISSKPQIAHNIGLGSTAGSVDNIIHGFGGASVLSASGNFQHHSRHPTFGATSESRHRRVLSSGGSALDGDRIWRQAYNAKLERTTPYLYALGLAACHSVVCFDPPAESQSTRKTYEGQSLDEVALVAAAADNNFELVKRTSKQMTFEIMGRCVVYDIIAEMEFTPQRKMMSIILKRNTQAERAEARERKAYLLEKERSERSRQEQEFQRLAKKKRNISKKARGMTSEASSASLATHTTAADIPENTRSASHVHSQSNADLFEHQRQATMVSVRSAGDNWHTPPPSVLPNSAEEALEAAINTANADHSNLFAYLRDDDFYESHPYLMLTKGADSSVLPNVDMSRARNSDVNMPVLGALAEMANEGLRTLIIANRWLTELDVQEYLPKLKSAQRSLRDRNAELHDAYAQIEHSFDIVGATAVEDKLQDGVPSTLEFLLQAEVVVWMLTGDKRETAVTIGATSGLLDAQQSDIEHLDVNQYPVEEHKMRIREQLKHLEAHIASLEESNKHAKALYEKERDEFYLAQELARRNAKGQIVPIVVTPRGEDSPGVTPRQLAETVGPEGQKSQQQQPAANADKNEPPSPERRTSLASSQRTFACISHDGGGGECQFPPPPLPRTAVMVIDGTTLQAALADDADGNGPSDRELFFKVGSGCRSAICCRLTPLQKADVVRLFQETTGHVALAIGDGANDVSMIQESEIGIGIMGLEGAQAELASDFAIPKFRHLKRLMVVHGRHCLYRDAGTVQFSLLKSLLLVTIFIIYATRSGFSGQALFTSWLLAALNALFVQIQALAIGIIDKDIDDVVLECFPQLYPELITKKSYFNPKEWLWMAGESVVLGGVFYVFCEASLAADDFENGKYGGFVFVSSLMFYVLCELIGIIAAVRFIRSWNWMTAFAIVFGLCTVPIFTISLGTISNVGGDSMNYYLPLTIYPQQLYWIQFWGATVGMTIIIVLTRRYVVDHKMAPTSSADLATTNILWQYEAAVEEAVRILREQQKSDARDLQEVIMEDNHSQHHPIHFLAGDDEPHNDTARTDVDT